MMGERKARLAPALVLALLVNAAGLYIVIQANRYVHEPTRRARVSSQTISIQESHRKKRRVRVRRAMVRTRARAVPLPVPDLPSGLSAAALLPELKDVDLVTSLMDTGQGLDADLVLKEEAVDEPARVIRRVAPDYPSAAEDRGIEGYVVLRLKVSASGRVEDVRVIESKPPGVFERAAVDAAKQYVFAPARFKGRPVAVLCKQKVVFKLED